MKSHYIPQMYLKGWRTGINGRGKQICVYEKNASPVFKPYKGVGYIEDYYLDTTEKWLDKELENKTAPILEKIGKKEILSSDERIKLAQFMFVIWQRVPFNIEGLSKDINNLMVDEILQPFRKWQKVLGINYKGLEERFKSGEYYKETYSELLMRNTFGQSEFIANMNWLFIKASKGEEFVTSDNPFFFDRRIGIRNYFYSYILFPINKDIVLLATHFRMPERNYEEFNENRTRDINRRIINNAYSQVYASFRDDKFSSFVNENIGKDLSTKHIIKLSR